MKPIQPILRQLLLRYHNNPGVFSVYILHQDGIWCETTAKSFWFACCSSPSWREQLKEHKELVTFWICGLLFGLHIYLAFFVNFNKDILVICIKLILLWVPSELLMGASSCKCFTTADRLDFSLFDFLFLWPGSSDNIYAF